MYIWSCRCFTKLVPKCQREFNKNRYKSRRYDSAVFYYYVKKELQGVVAAHVDDFCWRENQTFIKNIISPIKKIFKFDSKSFKTFTCLGLDLN